MVFAVAPGGPIPLTVIGGYLGAGKTTLVNQLLRQPEGRRIGVIVNDFGTIGIDVELLASSSPSGIISLPNGCVCCTIGAGLQEALAALLAHDPVPDHIVVEVSGVADPAASAAWATLPPLERGGVVVLAAADSVRAMARDRLVGGEVVRQLVGADLIIVTRSDLCAPSSVAEVERWLDDVTGGTPRVSADHGLLPSSVLLGPQGVAGRRRSANPVVEHHTDRYVTWEWSSAGRVTRADLDAFLRRLPAGVLRLKGILTLDDGRSIVVQRVGDGATVESRPVDAAGVECALVAIGRRDLVDPDALTRLADAHLTHRDHHPRL
jgi:G3E family GTPase